jgi:uncharacterized protein
MKIVGVEEHFLSPAVRASWEASPSAGQDVSESFHHGEILERVEELSDQRLARMDESGVDVQVLSLTSPGLHNLDPAEGISLARRTNDLIAATISSYPDRFDGFATIPTPAPREAVRELERSICDLGLPLEADLHSNPSPTSETAKQQGPPCDSLLPDSLVAS